MIVAELIAKLWKMPPDAVVVNDVGEEVGGASLERGVKKVGEEYGDEYYQIWVDEDDGDAELAVDLVVLD